MIGVVLDYILINDDHWWCIVTMMVETFVEHSRYISLFSETVEEEEQACIYSLSYQKTIDTVKTLSKQDPEKCPAVESICHYANTVLSENNGHLSTWLVARLIKYLIYRVKTKYVGRLKVEADLDCKINEECRAIQNTDSSNKRYMPVVIFFHFKNIKDKFLTICSYVICGDKNGPI
ncbi:PREDICTED: uncharacterized protein LOC108767576 [Trachymyrmex cornetzi]|uniref:uncharacterized protein LOC108767576 n=1 Tax=Trachymyrmex cornetzi TaxID=471704 RepID=UPI00084F41CD|nr:PREDICTED: uncharacterized protein LOC108767576 [Trachymyrmex cornetzi]